MTSAQPAMILGGCHSSGKTSCAVILAEHLARAAAETGDHDLAASYRAAARRLRTEGW